MKTKEFLREGFTVLVLASLVCIVVLTYNAVM